MTLGEKIRELRTDRGVTQRDLADALGVDHTYISKIENSAAIPGPLIVRGLAQIFDMAVWELGALVSVTARGDGQFNVKIPFGGVLAEWELHALRDALDAILPRPDVPLCAKCQAAPVAVMPGTHCAGCLDGILTERLRKELEPAPRTAKQGT